MSSAVIFKNTTRWRYYSREIDCNIKSNSFIKVISPFLEQGVQYSHGKHIHKSLKEDLIPKVRFN